MPINNDIPHVEVSEQDFMEIYVPIPNPSTTGGEMIWEWKEAKHIPPKRVWTIVDDGGETNGLYALPGFHIVNKIGYVVTEEPWEHDNITAIWMDPEDEEEDN